MKVRGSTGADMIRLFKLRGASRPCEDLRAERVDADNEEEEDRGRWRLARCYSSDGLGWDKTSTERTTTGQIPV